MQDGQAGCAGYVFFVCSQKIRPDRYRRAAPTKSAFFTDGMAVLRRDTNLLVTNHGLVLEVFVQFCKLSHEKFSLKLLLIQGTA